VIGPKARSENQAEIFKDNAVIPLERLPAAQLTPRNRQRLLAVIQEYVYVISPGQAKVRMPEIEAHLDQTYFA
jgi:hypothetical protein